MTERLWFLFRFGLGVAIILVIWHFAPRDTVTEGSAAQIPRKKESASATPEAAPSQSGPQAVAVSTPVENTTSTSVEMKSPAKEPPAEPRPSAISQPPIRVIQVLANDRMVIECAANGSFLARGAIKRLSDRRWVQDGLWTNYWPKGAVSSVGEWKEGAQVGPWLFASEDGHSTVTNHPPFASVVAVAQQTVPAATAGSPESSANPLVAAMTSRDSATGVKSEAVQESKAVQTCANQNSDATFSPASATPAAQPAKKMDPDVFVCGKHEEFMLKRGDDGFLKGQWQEAKEMYIEFARCNLDRPERAYAMLQKAVCEERLNKPGEARVSYQDYLRLYAREECGAKGQAGLAALLWKDVHSRNQAIAEYEKLIKNYPTVPETAAALKVLGDYFLGQKDYKRAQAFYATHLQNFAEASNRAEVEVQEQAAAVAAGCKDKMGLSGGVGFKEIIAGADDLMTRGRWKEAFQVYNDLLGKFSGSPECASYCLMQMGLCQLWLGQYEQARQRFQTLITKYPNSNEAPEACWRCVQFRKSLPSAVSMAKHMEEKYPGTFETEKTLFVLGTIFEIEGPKNRASNYWTEFLKKWPQTRFGEDVRERLAQLTPPSSTTIRLGAQQ